MTDTATDRLLTRPAAARILGRDPKTVTAMIDRGELLGYRIGGGVMVWESAVLAMIDAARIAPSRP